MSMTKMDKTWIAVASLIYPDASLDKTFSSKDVIAKVDTMFDEKINYAILNSHLVSSKDRMYDKNNPSRGGSRNKYLFKTIDGNTPHNKGKFRLYKKVDSQYDGFEKTGKICPQKEDINPEYYLVDWYLDQYQNVD